MINSIHNSSIYIQLLHQAFHLQISMTGIISVQNVIICREQCFIIIRNPDHGLIADVNNWSTYSNYVELKVHGITTLNIQIYNSEKQ